ncbi:hypothetical protein ACS33_15245 [Edwardsiella ictaluri]|nr:hypothetical protein ABY58_15440 [Edwardsiella ictaluri]KOO54231.1 hypothetical protein ACS33_15245 [Edwardsiella ictaluri]
MLSPLTAGAGSLLPALSGCGAGTASGTVTGAGTLSATGIAGAVATSDTEGVTTGATGATGAVGSLLPPAREMASDHAATAESSSAEIPDICISANDMPSNI